MNHPTPHSLTHLKDGLQRKIFIFAFDAAYIFKCKMTYLRIFWKLFLTKKLFLHINFLEIRQ